MYPVIQRELRAQSRNPALHRLRVLALLAILCTLVFLVVTQGLAGPGGKGLFVQLNVALTVIILLTGPALTADCLSRERREGTLGLLFLTPLRPRDVVRGKSLVHFLRVASLGLAVLPVLVMPLLMGGVTAGDILLAVTVHWLAATCGLGAGLVASSLAKSPIKALVMAYFLTGLTLTGGGIPVLLMLIPLFESFAAAWVKLGCDAVVLLGGGLFLILTQRLAAAQLASVWNLETQAAKPRPPSALEMPAPFMGDTARRWNRSLLAKNPLSWLHQRSIWSAMGRWGWVSLAIFLWFCGFFESGPLLLLEKLLLLGMCFAAARAFRDEKQNGTLELLLVTSLTESQILLSLLRLIVRHFAPPVLLHLGLVLYVRQLPQWGQWEFHPSWLLLSSLVTLPAIGGWVSLRSRHYLLAVGLTAIFGVAVPNFLPSGVAWVGRLLNWVLMNGAAQGWSPLASVHEPAVGQLGSVLLQLAVGAVAWWGLAEDLRRRRFITRPAET